VISSKYSDLTLGQNEQAEKMKKLWKEHLEAVRPYVPGKPIEEVKRELELDNVIKLASNENPLGPPPGVVRAITEAAGEVNRYPDGGCFYLRQALCEKLSISGDNVIFGNGSDEVIVLALRAMLRHDEEVIIAHPTFLIYNIASLVEEANVRTVPMKDFRYDLKAMAGAITDRTKIVFISNPDNPTGSYVTKDEMDDFMQRVPEGVVVFLDEAYGEFAKGDDYPETLELINREDKNVIITRTFSKAYSLAGLRVGYGLARKDIIEVLNKVREPFNVNSLAQAAALAALKEEGHLNRSLALVREEKKKFYSQFDGMDLTYIPSRTNFVLVNAGRDSREVFSYLLKRGVIVREMTSWGIDGFIRVNIGLREENEVFFRALKDAVRDIPRL